mgnify:CR=1 FL=1
MGCSQGAGPMFSSTSAEVARDSEPFVAAVPRQALTPTDEYDADKALQKKPAAKGSKPTKVSVVWDGKGAKGKPPCPKLGDGPVDYKTGRIYLSAKRKSFRIIRKRGAYETEAATKWKKDKPDEATWKVALKKIDDYKP